MELLVHLFLLNVALAGVSGEVHNLVFSLLHMSDQGVILVYMISTAIGYAIAFVMNRKISFKADSNVVLSVTLYIIMVICTIFANELIGDHINTNIIHGMGPSDRKHQIASASRKDAGYLVLIGGARSSTE